MQIERVETDKNGEVRLIGKRFELTDGAMAALAKAAKKNCKFCHGRGYSGRESITGMFLKCNCVKTEAEKLDEIIGESVDRASGRE